MVLNKDHCVKNPQEKLVHFKIRPMRIFHKKRASTQGEALEERSPHFRYEYEVFTFNTMKGILMEKAHAHYDFFLRQIVLKQKTVPGTYFDYPKRSNA